MNLKNEKDMLDGNINRMILTKDEDELLTMRDWALRRIEIIFEARLEELSVSRDK